MNYITTNVRLSEEDYLRLKIEAAGKRQSLAAVIREKISPYKHLNQVKVEETMNDLGNLAKRNVKKLKGWNSLKALREIRSDN